MIRICQLEKLLLSEIFDYRFLLMHRDTSIWLNMPDQINCRTLAFRRTAYFLLSIPTMVRWWSINISMASKW